MSRKRDTTRREARRERAEADQKERERLQKQRTFQSRVLFVVGLLALAAIGLLAVTRNDGANAGRVWSPEHGHWHDR